jgi:hypothetical protein
VSPQAPVGYNEGRVMSISSLREKDAGTI